MASNVVDISAIVEGAEILAQCEYGPFFGRFLRWRSFFCRAILEVAWSVLKDIWGFFLVAEIQLQRYDLPLQPSWARVAPCYDHDFHVDWSWSEGAFKWDGCQGSRLVVAHISRCSQCQVTSIQNVSCSKLTDEKWSKQWNHTNTHRNNAKELWHLFQTSEIHNTWAILHLFGQPPLFHSQPWQVISAFTSCVGALSTFSTCHLDFFHQDRLFCFKYQSPEAAFLVRNFGVDPFFSVTLKLKLDFQPKLQDGQTNSLAHSK